MADAGTRLSGILLCGDSDDLAQNAAALFEESAGRCAALSQPFCVMLAGGGTPRRTYESLAGLPYRDAVPWDCVHVFWGDERAVPSDHRESNYRMAWKTLLSKVALPTRNVHRVRMEAGDAKTVAAQYDRHLLEFFHLKPGQWPVFDLVLLGLGVDGHTASLFPESEALEEKERFFVDCFVEKLRAYRFTMTLPVLNHAKGVVFLVSGAEKADILKKVLEGRDADAHYPAARVKPASGNLLWLVDEAAASKLGPSLITSVQRSSKHTQ